MAYKQRLPKFRVIIVSDGWMGCGIRIGGLERLLGFSPSVTLPVLASLPRTSKPCWDAFGEAIPFRSTCDLPAASDPCWTRCLSPEWIKSQSYPRSLNISKQSYFFLFSRFKNSDFLCPGEYTFRHYPKEVVRKTRWCVWMAVDSGIYRFWL